MLAVAVAAGATLVCAGYQSMAPTGQWFGRAFCGAPRRSKQIALTFDDGPNDPHTLHLLDVLSKHNVYATFFVIGRYVRERPDIVREISRRGQVLGNHTFTHPLLTLKPVERVRQEIIDCGSALQDAIGEHSNLFRPPWGGRRPAVFHAARQLGLEPVMWNVTGYDWDAPSSEYIERRVTSRIRGGDVVLLHDGGHKAFGTDRAKTVQAVSALISRYKAEARDFVTIPQMMHPPQLQHSK